MRLICQMENWRTEWLLGRLGSRGVCSVDLRRALETTSNTLSSKRAISWHPWNTTSQDPTVCLCWFLAVIQPTWRCETESSFGNNIVKNFQSMLWLANNVPVEPKSLPSLDLSIFHWKQSKATQDMWSQHREVRASDHSFIIYRSDTPGCLLRTQPFSYLSIK